MATSATKTISPKRKRSSKTEQPPRKRARSASGSDEEADDETIQERLLRLEGEIYDAKKNLNNIVAILEVAQDKNAADDDDEGEEQRPQLLASVVLCRVFMRLLEGGSLTLSDSLSKKNTVVVQWLQERLQDYKMLLMDMFASSEEDASLALTLSMRLLQAEGQHLRGGGGRYYFPEAFLTSIVQSLILSRHRFGIEQGKILIDEYAEKFLGEFSDISFYTFKAVTATLEADDGDAATFSEDEAVAKVNGAFYLLTLITDVPESPEEFEEFYVKPAPKKSQKHPLHSVFQHKKYAQQAWFAVLKQATQEKQRKQVLNIMSTVIAPWFTHPEMLLDFITDCYNAGGSTSLLALSGLYYLIRERNVLYPDFYGKLYSLLDGMILHSKHRSRFFRLMDEFLASTHLPAQIVASFIKRVARLGLNAPVPAIALIVPWIYNMLQKHPLCTFMIHRVPRTEEEREALQNEGLDDPFLPDEADPMNTNAIDSCLWEIVQLQSHYHPHVATIARIISEPFTKQSYNLEDFHDHTYPSMLDTEFNKQIKKGPPVEPEVLSSVLFPQPAGSTKDDTLLVKLWDFA